MNHELKCWPEYYARILDGSKRFEFRRDDRDYQVGDSLLLREYAPEGDYTGKSMTVWVTYVLRGWLTAPGMAILSIAGCPDMNTNPNPRPSALTAKPAQFQAITGETSDGYHTFNELYEHRHALFAMACHFLGGWKSKLHSDGTMLHDWFIAGLKTNAGMATYHLPDRLWDRFPGREIERAQVWDGHTASDVIRRFWAHLETISKSETRDEIKLTQGADTPEASKPKVDGMDLEAIEELFEEYDSAMFQHTCSSEEIGRTHTWATVMAARTEIVRRLRAGLSKGQAGEA